MDHVECVVIGAGVVGLAVARSLALRGLDVLVLEEAETIGTGVSSRNSEVIHAGIYYPTDSWMARFCVAGRHALYAYCAERGIPYKRCGKLLVASSEAEAVELDRIAARAAANGVDDLRKLSADEAQRLEPNLSCVAAFLSPSTGLVDSHALMLSLQGDIEGRGGLLAFHSPVLNARAGKDGYTLEAGDADAVSIHCTYLVNAAGLQAPAVARTIEGLDPALVPQGYLAKGTYFQLVGRAPFSRLIYPVPVPGGLGVHLTLDLQGRARFGPDVEWVERIDYDVDPARADKFYAAIRRYWAALPDGSLEPAYSGIRPKITPPGAPARDFVIQGAVDHGLPGLVNLFGIESPGLTASLAIGEHVAALLVDERRQ